MSSKNEHFFISLPSNSSMALYPENTISQYITHLPNEVCLEGVWEVGLSEIILPNQFLDFEEEESVFYCYNLFKSLPEGEENLWLSRFKKELQRQEKWTDFQSPETLDNIIMKGCIAHGLYKDEEEVLQQLEKAINKALDGCSYMSNSFQNNGAYTSVTVRPEGFKHIQLIIKQGFLQLKRTCDCIDLHYIDFSEKLKKVLGLEDVVFLTEEGITSSRPCVLRRAKPDLVFVYSDIVSPVIVGDTVTSLLRIVTLDDSQRGMNVVKTFPTAQYHPLMSNTFRTIEVLLRDDLGNRPAFGGGVSSVTLHFRRIK